MRAEHDHATRQATERRALLAELAAVRGERDRLAAAARELLTAWQARSDFDAQGEPNYFTSERGILRYRENRAIRRLAAALPADAGTGETAK